MKKKLLALAAFSMLAGAALAQNADTLEKIKSSGTVNLGVRDSSGLGYTLGNSKYVGFQNIATVPPNSATPKHRKPSH